MDICFDRSVCLSFSLNELLELFIVSIKNHELLHRGIFSFYNCNRTINFILLCKDIIFESKFSWPIRKESCLVVLINQNKEYIRIKSNLDRSFKFILKM